MRKLLLVIAAALVLISCESTKSAKEGSQMDNNQSFSACEGNWQLTLLKKGKEAQKIFLTDLTIVDSGKGIYQISGLVGENRYTGTMSSAGEGLVKTESFGTTKRGVEPEVAEFEALFSEFMNGIDSFSVGRLSGEAFTSIEFKNSKMNATARFSRNSIYFKHWNLSAINDGKALSSVNSKASVNIERKDGVANIYTGINSLNLGVKIDEKKCTIAFADGPMTKAAGAPADMKIEDLLIKAIFKANRYSISGRTLTLYSDETILAEFDFLDLAK